MAIEKTDQQIKLKDGRMLGYTEYGTPEGKPVFYFHGFPGSRLDWPLSDSDDTAAELNARIIAIDRPGYGLSDFKPRRRILDWPDDVIELADTLKVDRFAVLGISGGGPYAAACAFKIPRRLTATTVVCGMGPPEAPGVREGAAMLLPGKSTLMRKLLLNLMIMILHRSPGRFTSQMKDTLAEPDKTLLAQPEVEQTFIQSAREAFRSGIAGANHEAGLYRRPWQFRLQDITADVHLWHGELDLSVPVSVGRYVANAIPSCRATFLKGEAHFSLPHNHIREILSTLI